MAVKINSVSGIPYDYYNNFTPSPLIIVIFSICIILYFFFFGALGTNSSSSSSATSISSGLNNLIGNSGSSGNSSGTGTSGSIQIIEILAWGVFVLLVLMNGMAYFFNIDITANLKNLFTATPELDITASPGEAEPIPISQEQVFHVPDNLYDYEDSKAICSAYGGRLATIQDMESAYKEGADWCGFGWSDGQMALYPTQYAKWEKLQTIHGHEHDCGRPGINGGFIDNPKVRFGINCFGKKPAINPEESDLMREKLMYPKTKKEIKFDKKVAYWQNNLNEISISPFNHHNWSIL